VLKKNAIVAALIIFGILPYLFLSAFLGDLIINEQCLKSLSCGSSLLSVRFLLVIFVPLSGLGFFTIITIKKARNKPWLLRHYLGLWLYGAITGCCIIFLIWISYNFTGLI
jgi:hypothetical protein